MDYESLYSTATKALNTEIEINDKLKQQIAELEAEFARRCDKAVKALKGEN